jgi:hypothetical protein
MMLETRKQGRIAFQYTIHSQGATMTMPNFFIIGAMKSGTTSLYRYLEQHPQVYMSPNKEPNFFAVKGEEELYSDSLKGPGNLARLPGIRDIETYCELFKGVSNETAIGEASHVYLYIPKAVERIKHYLPDAKLIAILRHPVERAYSHFMYRLQHGQEALDADFLQLLQEEEERVSNDWSPVWHYKRRGLYYVQLKRYFDTFNRNQIKVYIYEDFFGDNVIDNVQDMFRFLGVDDTFVPDIRIHNVSRIPRNTAFFKFITQSNSIKSILKPFLPKKWRGRIQTHLKQMYLKKEQHTIKPKLDPAIRRQLTEEYYKDDILKLQELIQRDISKWLAC